METDDICIYTRDDVKRFLRNQAEQFEREKIVQRVLKKEPNGDYTVMLIDGVEWLPNGITVFVR